MLGCTSIVRHSVGHLIQRSSGATTEEQRIERKKNLFAGILKTKSQNFANNKVLEAVVFLAGRLYFNARG